MNTMTTDKIIQYASTKAGFAVYPETDAFVKRLAQGLVASGHLTRTEKTVSDWTLVIYHAVWS